MLKGVCTEYQRISDRISDLYHELNTGEYDRAETTLFGIEIRLWRTRINCGSRTHLGYKSSWESDYITINKSGLVEYLYKRKLT